MRERQEVGNKRKKKTCRSAKMPNALIGANRGKQFFFFFPRDMDTAVTSFCASLERALQIETCHKLKEIGAPSFRTRIPSFWSKGAIIQCSRLNLLRSVLTVLILTSTLPLTRSLLPSPTQQGRPSFCMALEVLAKLMSTTPFAITCASEARLFFM